MIGGIRMLKGIPPILPPDLLKAMAEMGHGNELTIGDANFPSHSCCGRVVRMDGHGVPEILTAVLQLFPLDTFVPHPAVLMQVVPGSNTPTPIWDTCKRIVGCHDSRGNACFEEIERFEFYDRVKARSFVAIQSGETALYANIILIKGVITP
jgi:L-fucose mutarotase